MLTPEEKLQYLLIAELELTDFLLDNKLSTIAENKPEYKTNFIGSKQKLLVWIKEHTPDNISKIADMFSGSSAVSYMFKEQGYSVISNDRLKYCFHIAKAIVENNSIRLENDEANILLLNTQNSGNFVQKVFKNIYFEKGVHRLIDNIRYNIEKLTGFKKDIALFALGKTCLTARGGFKHFETVQQHDDKQDSPEEFQKRFLKNVQIINELVFKGDNKCKAYNNDIIKILPKIKTDCVYLDPPYITEFSQHNYERSYHFIEGLMTYWHNKTIDYKSKTRKYEEIDTGTKKSNVPEFFRDFLSAADHIPYWMISYRDKSYPKRKAIEKIITDFNRNYNFRSKIHNYKLNPKKGRASRAREYLFICHPDNLKNKMTQKADILIQNAKNYFNRDFLRKNTDNSNHSNKLLDNKESENEFFSDKFSAKTYKTDNTIKKNKTCAVFVNEEKMKKPAEDLNTKIERLEKEVKKADEEKLQIKAEKDELEKALKHASVKSLLKQLKTINHRLKNKNVEDKEFERLMSLSDEEFEATLKMVKITLADNNNEKNTKSDVKNIMASTRTDNENKKSKRRVKKVLKTDAGIKPFAVYDRRISLEENLKTGIKRAYDIRYLKKNIVLKDDSFETINKKLVNNISLNSEHESLMKTMSIHMSEALNTPSGLRAFASAIENPVKKEINKKYFTPLLLSENHLPKNAQPSYTLPAQAKAYWISLNGEAVSYDYGDTKEVKAPIRKIHSMPMMDIQSIRNGDIEGLLDVQKQAANAIRKEIDRLTIKVISKAVPKENTITIAGGKLTEEALNLAMSNIEDMDERVGFVILRGKRFNDMRGWELDAITKNELRKKGIIKYYSGAHILLTSFVSLNEVLVLPDSTVGKFPILNNLKCDPVHDVRKFKTGWLVWMDVGHVVLEPYKISKIIITD